MNDNKRLAFIDAAKGLAIILVILSHSEAHSLMIWANGFFIAIFFILSGYCFSFNNKTTISNITHKANKLLVPYFKYSIILFLIYLIFKGAGYQDLLGILYGRYDMYPLQSNVHLRMLPYYCTPLWFLLAMFISYVIVYIVQNKNIYYQLGIIILCLIVTTIMVKLPILLPWSLDTSFLFVGFLFVGIIYKRYEKYLGVKFVVLSLILYIICFYLNDSKSVNLSIREYGQSAEILFIEAVSGSIFIMEILKKLEGTMLNKILCFLGRHSLIIFCLHLPILYMFQHILHRIF